MPTYEYRCRSCGHTFDIVQAMIDEALTICPVCGGELRKVFAPPAISFKGSGFYATDRRQRPETSEKTREKPGEKPSEKTAASTESPDSKGEKKDKDKKDSSKPAEKTAASSSATSGSGGSGGSTGSTSDGKSS